MLMNKLNLANKNSREWNRDSKPKAKWSRHKPADSSNRWKAKRNPGEYFIFLLGLCLVWLKRACFRVCMVLSLFFYIGSCCLC